MSPQLKLNAPVQARLAALKAKSSQLQSKTYATKLHEIDAHLHALDGGVAAARNSQSRCASLSVPVAAIRQFLLSGGFQTMWLAQSVAFQREHATLLRKLLQLGAEIETSVAAAEAIMTARPRGRGEAAARAEQFRVYDLHRARRAVMKEKIEDLLEE